VFSHLPEDVEMSWLREFRRVGVQGCLYPLTVHGDWFIEATLGAERARAETAGFYFRRVHTRYNTELDFPEGYDAHSGDCDRPFQPKVITDSGDRDHAVARPIGSA
jgi:hypothetical protein